MYLWDTGTNSISVCCCICTLKSLDVYSSTIPYICVLMMDSTGMKKKKGTYSCHLMQPITCWSRNNPVVWEVNSTRTQAIQCLVKSAEKREGSPSLLPDTLFTLSLCDDDPLSLFAPI